LTLRVRPYIYLHVVIDLPRLPRPVAPSKSQSVKESKSRTTGSRPATVKWEYVGHAVVDEPIFEAMAKAWNAFVERHGEPPEPHPESDGQDEDAESYHRSLERFFMPWLLTWDIGSLSFPHPPATSASATGTIKGDRKSSSLRKSIAGTGAMATKTSTSRSSLTVRDRPAFIQGDPTGSAVVASGTTTTSTSASASALTAALADTLRLSGRKQS